MSGFRDFLSRHNLWKAVTTAAILGLIIGIAAVLWKQRQVESIPPRTRSTIETNPRLWYEEANEARKKSGLPPLPPFEDVMRSLPPNPK